MEFFTAASANLVEAAKTAGVGHYVALSIVGADGMPDSGYMRAKVVQERTITQSGLQYTIVRATQFHEFADMIVGSLTVGDEVRVPDAAPTATYFGTPVTETNLVTVLDSAVIAKTRFADWVAARE